MAAKSSLENVKAQERRGKLFRRSYCSFSSLWLLLQVLRWDASRPRDACRCPHGVSPSSFFTAVGSSTLCSPPELPGRPKITLITDENFRRHCDLNCACCRLRNPSPDNSIVAQIESRLSSVLSMCSLQGPLAS